VSDFLDDDWDDGDAIRVVVCDDHALFRRGLMMVLEDESDLEVLAEAADGKEAVDVCIDLAPDVILMDARMPGQSGIAATRAIREAMPTAKVIMLTVSDDEEDLFGSIRAGAAGYLLKEISIDEVADAVRAVMRGESLISPSMASKLMSEFAELSRSGATPRADSGPTLTKRELEVLSQVAEGGSNREIAQVLGISENTVKNHVRNILEKLHLHSRMEAVVYAVRANLLDIS
jgi:two-component system NarL family response regulator